MAESEEEKGADFLSVETAHDPSIRTKRRVTFIEEIEEENLQKTESLDSDSEVEENIVPKRTPSALLNTPLQDFDACEGQVSKSIK